MGALRHEAEFIAARRAAEEVWCARVRAAKERFDLAVAQVAKAEREPGLASLAWALQEDAREEYLRELQVFTDLIVRGKMPPQD